MERKILQLHGALNFTNDHNHSQSFAFEHPKLCVYFRDLMECIELLSYDYVLC